MRSARSFTGTLSPSTALALVTALEARAIGPAGVSGRAAEVQSAMDAQVDAFRTALLTAGYTPFGEGR